MPSIDYTPDHVEALRRRSPSFALLAAGWLAGLGVAVALLATRGGAGGGVVVGVLMVAVALPVAGWGLSAMSDKVDATFALVADARAATRDGANGTANGTAAGTAAGTD